VPEEDHEAVMLSYDFTSTEMTAVVGKGLDVYSLENLGVDNEEAWNQKHFRLVRRTKLHLSPGEALQLQLFMDYSVLEVFFGDGQVLSTRVYRGEWGLLEGFAEPRAGEQEAKVGRQSCTHAAFAAGHFGIEFVAGPVGGVGDAAGGVLGQVSMHVMETCWGDSGQSESN
jgi:hypothetical protein